MHTFKDDKDRSWDLEVTVDAIKRVRALTGVDLREALGGELLNTLAGDPVMVCDVVYAICKPQAEERRVSDEEFGRAMHGDALDNAGRALVESLSDFFPNPRDRVNLKAAAVKLNQALDRARDRIEERMRVMKVDKLVDQAFEKLTASSGDVPASAESTQGHSLSASS